MPRKLTAKLASMLVLFLFLMQGAFAQTKVVTGKVTDNNGAGVPGVTVTVRGTKTSTQTDNNGDYRITVPENGTLVFSSVGYANSTMSVAGRSSMDVSLTNQTSNLNEVVVVGYGTARKRDITGSVVVVGTKEFNQGVITSPDQLLQNKVAGLEITNTSGQPGAATTIQIRGTSSIRSGNNPLFVVDGVPLDGATPRPNISTGAFGISPGSDPLLFINPYDIASITVLKDASSAAIYGSRGANGVVEITTKKGSSGPMRIDVGSSFSVNTGLMRKFNVLNPGQFRSALAKYSLPAALDSGANTDAIKEIEQHKLSQTYNIALSGGNDVGKFRASFLAASNYGILKKTNLDKYIATFGGTYKFLDKRLTLDFGVITANIKENVTAVANNSGSQGNVISSALIWNPTVSLRNKSGLYNLTSNGGVGNPLALNDAYSDVSYTTSVLANISAAYKIMDNLEYKFLYAINNGNGNRFLNIEGFLAGYNGLSGQGYGAIGNAKLTSETFTHTLNYNTDLNQNLKLNAVVGYEYWKSDYSGGSINGSGFNTNLDQSNRISLPYTTYFQNAHTLSPYNTFANPTREIQSVFARASINFMDKFNLSAVVRDDGSSQFGSNNKYGIFPSIGASYAISKESFLKNSTAFSNLIIRASYGITGNQAFPAGAADEQFGLGSFDNGNQFNVKNENVKWEPTRTFNVGLDFNIGKKGRIYGSVDYYNKNTTDLLYNSFAIAPAPPANTYINLPGHLINSGVEVALGVTVIDKPGLTWDVKTNVAYNKNILKNFFDVNSGLPVRINTGTIDGQGVSGTFSQIITNGYPLNEYYLKHFTGYDANGNQLVSTDPTYAGNPNPTVIGGLSSALVIKKLTFSLNFGGGFGFKIYNNTATSVTNLSGIANGRNVDLNAYNSNEKPSSGVGASDRFLENGDYVKLRNATISYNFGNQGKYMKNLAVFVSGTNLFVITKFSGFDPEVNIDKSAGGYPSRSIEYIPYPTPRSVSFGLNFSL